MKTSISESSRKILAQKFLCAVPGERRKLKWDLKHGFRISSDGKQVASAYFSDNAPDHEVEFALDYAHLADTDRERGALVKWLRYQKCLFGGQDPKVHQRGDPVDWFRIGFSSVGDALTFLQSFKNERQMLNPSVRWQILADATSEASEQELPTVVEKLEVPEPHTARENKMSMWKQVVDRLVSTAQQTTSQSNGQVAYKTIKNKNNAFTSQEEFALYVLALIEKQDGCCAISGLPLRPDEQCEDVEMLASLDRIDSNGHYEPGNLQVVCRFINRWKGADENALFVRLIGALRSS
ncbi:hypothetical protein [Vogesella indigofera]|uniref:hypothetical protein n=1 Tax=Vogesella indigofera TaxID=45465 RepID=UPI00234F8545|nr:hypothetical protein [Vogesella indigofera]MDC7701607.1 hypothetical protein [Vogesella indigofera]